MVTRFLATAAIILAAKTATAKGIAGTGAPDNRDDAQCLAPFGIPTCADITRATDRGG
ncbi:MAG: hypothetical protein AAF718_12000 [Pseudomonadota bacterium]